MAIFTPETPLGQRVQEILLQTPTGLTLLELRRHLRSVGMQVSEENLKELLAHRRTFTLLPQDRYALATHTSTSSDPAHPVEQQPEALPSRWQHPLIGNVLHAKSTYVVVDLETTGISPERDRIVQIAALKVVDNQPVAVRNWYVSQDGLEIPYTIQLIIGATHPSVAQAIAAAPALVTVLSELVEFTEALPLVAHNARFDARFLEYAHRSVVGSSPSRLLHSTFPGSVVDTMELALLLLPNSPSHQLDVIASQLEVALEEHAHEWSELTQIGLLSDMVLSVETLHNAVTDVWLLHHVYQALLKKWSSPGTVMEVVHLLLPEATAPDIQRENPLSDLLALQRKRCNWIAAGEPSTPPQVVPPPSVMLEQYLGRQGRQPRQGQQEMCHLITSALDSSVYCMVEAPTGTGKTLAYLMPAIHHALTTRHPVVVSTAYRNLQEQLVEEIQDFHAQGTVRFRSQLLKGISNYFCWSQIEHFAANEGHTTEVGLHPLSLTVRFTLAYVVLWLPTSVSGSTEDVSYWLTETFSEARGVIDQLKASAACDPQLQPTCTACPMPAAYTNARIADVVVINHALWLSEPLRMPPFTSLILDEAHTLEDVATAALAEEVSSDTLRAGLAHFFDPATQRGLLPRIRAAITDGTSLDLASRAIGTVRRVMQLADEFGVFLVQFIRRCTDRMDPRFGASLRLEAPPWQIHAPAWQSTGYAHQQLFGLHLKELLAVLKQLSEALRFSSFQGVTMDAITRDLSEWTRVLGDQYTLAYDLLKVNNRRRAYWVEVGPPQNLSATERDSKPTRWAMKSAPINIGDALQPFYEKLGSVSFVSATLALKGNDFSYFVERLGLTSWVSGDRVRQIPPALPYKTNVFLALTDFFTYAPLASTMASFQEELAKELKAFLHFTDGRALGLFTARARMETVAAAIQASLADQGIPLYVQQPMSSRRRLLEDFKQRTESVLFGLRSFWEGVDAPGETLSFVLMEKLPFPLLIDPVHRARAEALLAAGKSEFEDYMLPLMLLQFKQGFGRLMRRDSDRGAVILYDKRIHRKSYKADLLSSLPGYLPRDERNERSRRLFYQALATTFPDLINLDVKQEWLASLPDDLFLDLENTLANYRIPLTIPLNEYDNWRPILLQALSTLFEHTEFRRVAGVAAQDEVIRYQLAGRDVLGILPTGSGKSLTFQLPALLRDGVTLVFSPLIALMKDQVTSLNAKGIEVVGAIYSGQSASERDDVLERMQTGRARLVYVSPERLRDPRLLAALRYTKVIQVVVDEAHCVYMWGPSFRPDFLYLPRLFAHLGYRPPLLALTATATEEMQSAIIATLEMQDIARVVVPIDRPELQFVVFNNNGQFHRIGSRSDRLKQLVRILHAADRNRPPILIYVATTVEAEQLSNHLRKIGHDVRAYHGKLTPQERTSVQELFMDDHINMVVCTKAFGMGIDKAGIRYVIHYNMPGDLESYFQEAGRAGRDGQPAYCILLYHPHDIATQQYFLTNGAPDGESINRVLAYLSKSNSTTLYLDPDALCEHLHIEDVQLRVALHHLETQGWVRRTTDFTLTGALTLQFLPEDIIDAWQRDREPELSGLRQLLETALWPSHRKLEIDLTPIAQQTGLGPERIDALLIRLSQRREAVYVPWRRGFVVERQVQAVPHDNEVVDFVTAQHHSTLTRKLDTVVAYATSNQTCRRQVILNYFGQAASDMCGGCDVCDPHREWPWSAFSQRDAVSLDHFLDPAFVILELVQWNLERAKKYGSPYGTGTLLAVLAGNEYAAVRHEADPHLRQWRLQQLRQCPHWSVFSLMSSRDQVLQRVLDRLLTEHFVEEQYQSRDQGEPYKYLALTQKGRIQLTSGTLLQWERV